jgi:hypothetical protein
MGSKKCFNNNNSYFSLYLGLSIIIVIYTWILIFAFLNKYLSYIIYFPLSYTKLSDLNSLFAVAGHIAMGESLRAQDCVIFDGG